ncbi:MAG: hypothetical protein LBD82_06200 [Deltaproteobacteria bacterium]|jgi:hypothetical protein|nr:hypothetical protein [Deltaproteobacteria bacterium]
MMMKLTGPMLMLLFISMLLPGRAFGEEHTPEQFIKNFYSWYITVDEGRGLALKNDDIYQYVDAETVKQIRNTSIRYGGDRRDYFIKLDVERHVAHFYIWYISESSKGNSPIYDDMIYEYVNHCVVSRPLKTI